MAHRCHLQKKLMACVLLVLPLWCLAAPPLKLHVPSPDWRDQVIYFVMTDRFADGDPRNNDQGAGEYDPQQSGRYSGGDLKGLQQRIPYIQGLGATAVWITPPVANQWRDPWAQYSGYHGYWAENFMQVDKHLGTLADYKQLSHALHTRGMYLVQDIVVNHTGNFFRYGKGWSAADPVIGFEINSASLPRPAPTQAPFSLNDPRRATDRRAGIYHWTPDINDYTNPVQELNWQMSGLDDLNTENPVVRRALRRSFGYWVKEVGVDAFRVDTAFYVPADYFADFLHSRDRVAPGMAEVARRTGRNNFLVFGEGFGIDKPFDDTQARKIERYMTSASGQPLMTGMLNFPLYGALGDAFARGRPPAELGHRIAAAMKVHARPHLMPSFIDNHDVDRFLAGGSVAGLKQALLAMFTLPGIPVVYFGTEQGFTQQRASMFAAGWGSGGRDHFDTTQPLYRFIAEAAALRRNHRLFSRGTPTVLQAATAAPGALAWRMAHEGQTAVVVFNTADHEVLLDNLDLGVPAGTRLRGLLALEGSPLSAVVGERGRLSLRLPPRSGWVWELAPSMPVAPTSPGLADSASAAPPQLMLDPLPAAAVSGDFVVSGQARGLERFQLVVDGQLGAAREVVAGPDGRWQTMVDTATMVDPAVAHRLVAFAETGARGAVVSDSQSFRVQRTWTLLADVEDPAGDDLGPAGRYTYPTDPSYAARHMDLRRVRVFGAGGALRIELTMNAISTVWAPANGFDHVAFTLFVQLPGQAGGLSLMPFQNASLPVLPGGEAMRWHRRLRAHGWSNALFSDTGAAANADGTTVSPAANIQVDAAARTVTFTLPAAALGRLASLSGARIYVTTWDYDSGYRALGPAPAPYAMGGGDALADAKVMDASPVIVLP